MSSCLGVFAQAGIVKLVMSDSCCRKSLLGVLNDNDFQGHIDPQVWCISEASGRFKKVRPARLQSFLRAERTFST